MDARGYRMLQKFHLRDSSKKAVPLSMCSTLETAVLLLVSSSPKEASASSIETRPSSREYWRSHYVFRCFGEIMSRCNNRMLPIHVYNRMDKWLFNWEELVMVTTLCRAYDWLQLALWHLAGWQHSGPSTVPPTVASAMSTMSMVHHHLHSPPSIYYM